MVVPHFGRHFWYEKPLAAETDISENMTRKAAHNAEVVEDGGSISGEHKSATTAAYIILYELLCFLTIIYGNHSFFTKTSTILKINLKVYALC